MKTYILTEDAEHDIDAIKVYLRRKGGTPLARHIIAKLFTAFQFLGSRPGSGHSRTDLTSDPVKFWQVSSYFIIYDPTPRPIEITRVLHTSRDLSVLLRG